MQSNTLTICEDRQSRCSSHNFTFEATQQITTTMIKTLTLVLSALSLADASPLRRRTRRIAFAGRIVDPVDEEERYVNSECIIAE